MEVALVVLYLVALGHGSDTNIALHKSARQSSLYGSGFPSLAVDGKKDQYYGNRSCSHTYHKHNAWWEVDLFGFYEIDRVVVFNRRDCCSHRLRNISIEVFWNDRLKFVNEEPLLCGTYPGTVGVSATIRCPTGVRGRFVKITLYNPNQYLTLCEVQVYGVATPKPGAAFEPLSDISWTSSYPLDRSSMHQCGDTCFRTDTCFAFDYNFQSHECQLVGNDTYTPKGEPWVYFGLRRLIKTPNCH
ncbi:fucolectin-1-like [Gigantopelta aegis]|uniref:fucolectin-1-like n=1 Tax=Gigantopelta aegis TaxID=1735272 RepID=UPI001B88E0C3|nr:fucolectin-1-like [Gigantopelta aegis]